MSALRNLKRLLRPPPREGAGKPPRFPTASTYFAMAFALIAFWLLAGGLPHLVDAWEHPASRNTPEAGASK